MILRSLVKVIVIRTDLNCDKSMYNKSETVTVIKPEWGHQKPLPLTILSSQHTTFDLSVWSLVFHMTTKHIYIYRTTNKSCNPFLKCVIAIKKGTLKSENKHNVISSVENVHHVQKCAEHLQH